MLVGIIEVDKNCNMKMTSVNLRRNVVSNLHDVPIATFDANDFDAVYLLVQTQKTIVHDISLPKVLTGKNLVNALSFEMEDFLPVSPDEVVWGYRSYPKDKKRFSIYAIHREEFDKVISAIEKTKIRCDAFVPADLLCREEKESVLKIFLEYLKSDSALNGIKSAQDMFPSAFRPERYKTIKFLYWLGFAICLLLFFSILYTKYQDFSKEYSKLSKIQASQTKLYKESQAEFGRLGNDEELFQKISEAKIGTALVLPLLGELAERLPRHMWITHYSQTGSQIDLTISSAKDDLNLYRLLDKGTSYQLVNLRKNRSSDNRTIFYLKLRSRLP